jgi:hypothetical protein
MTFFAVPAPDSSPEEQTTEQFVDAVGMVFETVHAIFERQPALYDDLSAGAVFVPLFALETAQKQNNTTDDALLSFLFSNLDYPFSQQEFSDYLLKGAPLAPYTDAAAPTGSFWRAVARDAEPEEYSRLMTAMQQMLSAVHTSSEDVLTALCRLCNWERMRQYCREDHSADAICAELIACYSRTMENSGEILPEEERAFLLSALLLYSVWELTEEDGFAEAAEQIPMTLAFSAADFRAMMEHEESRQTLDELFACTENSAGGFWKTFYAAAKQAGNESLVAEEAVYLEALLSHLCGSSEKLQWHRERLFAIVS